MAFEEADQRGAAYAAATRLAKVEPDVAAAPPARKRAWVGTLVRALVSFGAIVVVLSMVDFNEAFQRAAAQDFALLGLAVAIMFVQLVLGAMRWHAIRTGLGCKVSFSNTFQLYYVGSFFSTYVLSGVSGDVMRGWLSYKGGIDPTTSVNSVILDRVVVLAGVAIMMLVATPWFLIKFGTGVEGWTAAILSFGLFVGIFGASQLYRLPASWQSFMPVRLAQKVGAGMHDVFMRPVSAARGILSAVLAQIGLAAATYALAMSLQVNVSFIDCVIVMQIVAVLNAIPISVGGWGVREAAMVTLFGLIGVEAHSALLLSVELGLIGLAVNLPGGPLWLFMRRRTGSRTAEAPVTA